MQITNIKLIYISLNGVHISFLHCTNCSRNEMWYYHKVAVCILTNIIGMLETGNYTLRFHFNLKFAVVWNIVNTFRLIHRLICTHRPVRLSITFRWHFCSACGEKNKVYAEVIISPIAVVNTTSILLDFPA